MKTGAAYNGFLGNFKDLRGISPIPLFTPIMLLIKKGEPERLWVMLSLDSDLSNCRGDSWVLWSSNASQHCLTHYPCSFIIQ